MSLIFRNLGQFPEETAHVLQNLVSANGLTEGESFQLFKEQITMPLAIYIY